MSPKDNNARPPMGNPRDSLPRGAISQRPLAALPDEAEIDSPNRESLIMISVVCGLTFTALFLAYGSCNAHPPLSNDAPILTTDRLASSPKDAAIELQQRLLTLDFDGALELCGEDVERQVLALQAECNAKGAECADSRKRLAGKVFTKADLLALEGDSATARVLSTVEGKEKIYTVDLKRSGPVWKTVARRPL